MIKEHITELQMTNNLSITQNNIFPHLLDTLFQIGYQIIRYKA